MALIERLTAIGNAIREKNGTTEKIPLVDMPQAILDIVSGDNDTKEIEALIDESGVLEEGEYTLTEKVQRLIDIIKAYQSGNPEETIPENVLRTLEGYLLKDKNGT